MNKTKTNNSYEKLEYKSSLDDYPKLHKHLSQLILNIIKKRQEIDAITIQPLKLKTRR